MYIIICIPKVNEPALCYGSSFQLPSFLFNIFCHKITHTPYIGYNNIISGFSFNETSMIKRVLHVWQYVFKLANSMFMSPSFNFHHFRLICLALSQNHILHIYWIQLLITKYTDITRLQHNIWYHAMRCKIFEIILKHKNITP